MKILFFDNSGIHTSAGLMCCEPNTGNFARELRDLGNDIIFYGQIIIDSDTVHTYDLKANGIKVVGLKRKKNKLWNYICLYFNILFYVYKSDFVYIYYPNAFKYAAVISKLMGVKYGLYVRGMRGINTCVSRWMYKNAYTIFTVSDRFSSFIDNIVGKEIANTIRPMIPYSSEDICYHRLYEIKKNHFNILFLARVAEDKGVKELFYAMKILKDKGYSFHLTFIGDGEFMEQTKDLIKKLELDDWVLIRGAVYDIKEKKDYFLSSDIYILPTYHEGFPRTLYEAMIFGTPIVTTMVGGISALMKDKYNCKEIEPHSVESVVNGLQYAMDNYSEMVSYAKQGFHTVEKIVDVNRLTHAQHLNQIINN